MKNDPIIHAKASKIVEAIVPIIKEQLLKQMHPMVHQNEYPSKAVPLAVIVDMMPLVRQPLTEALASLESRPSPNQPIPNKMTPEEFIKEKYPHGGANSHSVFDYKELIGLLYQYSAQHASQPHQSEREVLEGKVVKLGELDAGKLFRYNETVALKSEYITEKGAVEAFIVGSGEMFWGGTTTPEDQVELEVIELADPCTTFWSLNGKNITSNNSKASKLYTTPFSIKFPNHKDGDLYLLFWLDDVPPDIAYLHKDTGNNGVLMRLKGTDVIVNTDIKIIRRKIEFMAFPAVNWSRVCECDWDSKVGETWCCNHCGLPTSNHSHPSEREVLVNYADWFEDNKHNLVGETIGYVIDRYISEKQSKTEEKPNNINPFGGTDRSGLEYNV